MLNIFTVLTTLFVETIPVMKHDTHRKTEISFPIRQFLCVPFTFNTICCA